jgi:hypothetical protein
MKKVNFPLWEDCPNAQRFLKAVAEFIVPDWGDKVNSGIGLSYRPAGGPVRQPYGGVDYISPVRDHEFGLRNCCLMGSPCICSYKF